jgi:hypothetical protein
MAQSNSDVRFTPNSGHSSAQSKCPLWAITGRSVISIFIEISLDGQLILQYLLKYEKA